MVHGKVFKSKMLELGGEIDKDEVWSFKHKKISKVIDYLHWINDNVIADDKVQIIQYKIIFDKLTIYEWLITVFEKVFDTFL